MGYRMKSPMAKKVPNLGERIGTALKRGQSLELYLASKGEKVKRKIENLKYKIWKVKK